MRYLSSIFFSLGLLIGCGAPTLFAQSVITTLAGKEFVYPRATRAALEAPLGPITDVAWGPMGELYIADPRNRLVLRLDPSGSVRIFAGNGFDISSGDGGDADAAGLRRPVGLAVGPDGSVYVADQADHRIRRVLPDGTIETFAGTGRPGGRGDGLRANRAELDAPGQMTFDGMGNLYVAELGGGRIRRIDRDGFISTVIDAVSPTAVAVDLEGFIWFGDAEGLKRFPAGAPADVQLVGRGLTIGGLAVDPMGILTWSTAGQGHQVFDLSGSSGVIVGNGSSGLVVGNGFPGASGDGGPARDGRVNMPLGLDFSRDGRLAIADSGNGLVRQVDPNDILSRLAGSRDFRFTGDGGPAPLATLNSPQGVAVTTFSELLIADTGSNRIRVIGQDFNIDSLDTGSQDGDALDPQGLSAPTDVVDNGLGELFVADRGNLRVARLTGGIPETVAGGGFVRSRDNIPATEARLLDPTDIAFDMAGNLLLTDRGEHRVRFVNPGGLIGSFAGTGQQGGSGDNGQAAGASLNQPTSVATGPAGETYIVDQGNNRVRVVDAGGIIRRFAGNGQAGFAGDGQAATQAQLDSPTGVTVGGDGTVYIADSGNNRIRAVGLDQVIRTVAGNGIAGYSGDGGPATQAALRNPTDVAVDSLNNLFVADEGNDRVRFIPSQTPQFALAAPSGGATDLVELQTFVGKDSPAKVISLNPDIDGLLYEVTLLENGSPVSSLDWLDVSPLQGAMPASLRIIGKGESEGFFQGTIAVSIKGAGLSDSLVIDVNLVVDPPPIVLCPNDCTSPFTSIQFENDNLVFGTYQGGAPESTVIEPSLVLLQPLPINAVTFLGEESETADQSAEFDLFARAVTDDGQPWLTISPSFTMTEDRKVRPFEVVANPLRLPPGTYAGAIEIGGDGIPLSTLPVTMTVAPGQPKLRLDRTGLTFRGASGGPMPLDRGFSVINAGTGRMVWSATAETLEGGPWLSIAPRSGEVIGQTDDSSDVRVTVNPAGLAPGDYFGSIEITAPGTTPQSVTVIFNVTPADEPLSPDLSRNGLVFTAPGDLNPGSQDVTFANLNSVEVSYTVSLQGPDASERVLHAPTLGRLGPGERETVRVQPNFATTPDGVSRERLAVTFSVGGSSDVEITNVKVASAIGLTEEGRPAGGGCELSSLEVTPVSGGAVVRHPKGQPLDLEAIVLDNCGRPLTDDESFAQVKFSAPGTSINLQHKSEGLWTGSYQPQGPLGQISASYTAFLGFLPAQADITIEIIDGADVPLISSGGLVNAASFEQAPQISPGSLISLFGESLAEGSAAANTAPLPDRLSGSSVKLGDRSLKLFFAGGSQINAQIPFDIAPNLQHRIEIRRGNAASVPQQVTVAPTQPGIFAVNQAGTGQAVIVDAFTFVISDTQSPATAGAALSAFCTGLGAVDPPAPEGQQAPFDPLSRTVNPVTVHVDGQEAQMLFAGLAPGFAGLYQVNFIVPEGVTLGPAVPVTLTVDGKTSPPVTIAIQ